MYTIDPDGLGAFAVRCDMETTPGRGWTLFQRRVDGSEDFYRNWTDYKTGFGNLSGEFWLGLDKIHRLSASGQNVLRVDLETFEDEKAYAIYESFSVGNESEAYVLNIGNYSGTNKYSFNAPIRSANILRQLKPINTHTMLWEKGCWGEMLR